MTVIDSKFMVMGLNGLVLRDLVGMMKDAFPTLEAITAGNEADALAQLAGSKGWKYAFLDLGPDAFVASELSKILDALGTKIILLGNAAEDAEKASTFPVLVRPFFAGDILRLLK